MKSEKKKQKGKKTPLNSLERLRRKRLIGIKKHIHINRLVTKLIKIKIQLCQLSATKRSNSFVNFNIIRFGTVFINSSLAYFNFH